MPMFAVPHEEEHGMERIRLVIVGLAIVLVAAIVWAWGSTTTTYVNVGPRPTRSQQDTNRNTARIRAQDASAEATLRNALVAAKTDYADSRSYLHATPKELLTIEPSLSYVDGGTPSNKPTEVSVATVSHSTWAAAVLSESGTCFFIKNVNERVSYGSGTGACTGEEANASAADHSFPATA
jgi:hypothetical protein